jgi:hypothetical protein
MSLEDDSIIRPDSSGLTQLQDILRIHVAGQTYVTGTFPDDSRMVSLSLINFAGGRSSDKVKRGYKLFFLRKDKVSTSD